MTMTSSTSNHRKRRGASRRTNGKEHRPPRRRKMTAEEARAFGGFSTGSAVQVMATILARGEAGIHQTCACSPYDDVFTLPRWNAQGMSVKKGEKAMRIASFIRPGDKDGEGDPTPRSETTEGDAPAARGRVMPWTLALFCRCQVGPSKGGE